MAMSELEVLAHMDRGMLHHFVWRVPTEVLAERMRVSPDSVRQSCANRGIPMPDQGYWMRVAAGEQPPIPPLTDHRPGPKGTTGTAEEALATKPEEPDDDPISTIEETLGEGTVELIREVAGSIVVDPDAELRPHLRWQRDACRTEETLRRWLERNELPGSYLWREASPSSVARMCSILEALGRAVEGLGGTYDERGFDVFGHRVWVFFSEHLGKYRKGQSPSRTYNGLLSLYVGGNVYKDYRKKTLEQEVPMAFVNICVNAAYAERDRQRALEELVGTRARYAERQAAIAVENERRKAFNREVDHYEEALALAEAHDHAEKLRRYAEALEGAGDHAEASWVRAKADWADPVTHAQDEVFGTERMADGAAPKRLKQLPYETRGVRADGFFGMPIDDPSPTLEAFEEILRDSRARKHG